MDNLFFQLILIFLLLFANGVFAMTEIAIVSSRKGLLQSLADKGNKGAARALNLAENPNRFLSTVQIGITLVGIVAGAVGGASIAVRFAEFLAELPYIGGFAHQIAFVVVIGSLTYLSLVLGELVPKRLALQFPETIASAMSGPMAWLAKVGSPAVTLLASSTNVLLKLFRVSDREDQKMSREEFTVLVREALVMGSTDTNASEMIERVFDFEELDVYDIMISRPRMTWIECDASHEEVWPMIIRSTQDVFPVYQGEWDNLVGAVSIKDIYAHVASGAEVSFKSLMQPPLLVPETQKASSLLESFRLTGNRAAFVLDEFGGVIGMVTLIDLMESVIGDVHSKEEKLAMPIRKRTDGTWAIDGLFEIEKLETYLDGFVTPEGAEEEYQTVAGWFSKELGRVPSEGDTITGSGWRFEIIDMDASRVDKIIARFEGPPSTEGIPTGG